MSQPRDSQRSKLYAAERTLVEFDTPRYADVAAMQSFVDRVTASRWFQARWGARRIIVRPGYGRRRAAGGNGKVWMPLWSRTPLVLLHEVAHNLQPDDTAWHGPEFAAIYLALVAHELGDEVGNRLRATFVKGRVKHRWRIEVKPWMPVARRERVAAARRMEQDRYGSPIARDRAAGVIRYQVRQGLFGPSGSATRKAALVTARALDTAAARSKDV